jgi:hypothetical protein
MTTAKDLTEQLIFRAKNLQEFVVERDIDIVPLTGVIKFSIQHTIGQPARIFVPALTQQEAEEMVDEWLEEDDE